MQGLSSLGAVYARAPSPSVKAGSYFLAQVVDSRRRARRTSPGASPTALAETSSGIQIWTLCERSFLRANKFLQLSAGGRLTCASRSVGHPNLRALPASPAAALATWAPEGPRRLLGWLAFPTSLPPYCKP